MEGDFARLSAIAIAITENIAVGQSIDKCCRAYDVVPICT
jgi:hypothetical protein